MELSNHYLANQDRRAFSKMLLCHSGILILLWVAKVLGSIDVKNEVSHLLEEDIGSVRLFSIKI